MGWREEFPKFKPEDMPEIPAGFEDTSWHLDSCPSFRNEALRVVLFIEPRDPQERDIPETDRFNLYPLDKDDVPDGAKILDCTDDWDQITKTLAELVEAHARGGLT